MKCKETQELMGAYLYGDLTPDEMRGVREHTQGCNSCREDVESRGRVVASLDGTAPELTDEERMRISWAVKGAIRNSAPARSGWQFTRGYVFALGGVVMAGLAVAAIMWANSNKPPMNQQAREGKSGAIVEVTEVTQPEPPKDVSAQGGPSDVGETSAIERLSNEAMRSLSTISSREHRIRRHTAPREKPAQVLDEPKPDQPKIEEPRPEEPKAEEPKAEPAAEGMKLPEPTDANDARTAE